MLQVRTVNVNNDNIYISSMNEKARFNHWRNHNFHKLTIIMTSALLGFNDI